VTTVDWIAIAVVVLSAIGGWRRGLVASALSLAGLLLGAYAGSRVGPHLLTGGSTSPWTPLAGLIGAFAGAALLQTLGSIIGSFIRGGLKLTPFRVLDSLGGIVVGGATGLVVVWVAGATALLIPGQTSVRQEVLRSEIVRHLNDAVPPARLLHLLARVDPFPTIVGPAAPSSPASPAIVRKPGVQRAEASVVKVVGFACGIGVEGSGWFARRNLVVTAAHVVAGERNPTVAIPGSGTHDSVVVSFDPRNDVAVLRVAGATGAALRYASPTPGTPVAILGYPDNGPQTATPGRIGSTASVLARDAYGNGPIDRLITAVAGVVRHGNSGGPAVDADGVVRTTIFAARIGSPTGYGIPTSVVARALSGAQRPVSAGSCAG
jgi:S1-C subfamily serine protease